ncbi:V-type ATPase subunit, partial [Candidatus Margulisiibacteriota bacterium]
DIMSFLWSRHDLYNAKILLKSRYLSVEPKELSDIGTVDQERLKKYILNDEKTSIPDWLVQGVLSAKSKFELSKDPKTIDIVLDKVYIEFLKKIAGSAENRFLKDLLRTEVDLYNIKTFIRLRAAKKEDGLPAEVLVQGGSKAKSFYSGLAQVSDEETISAFKDTPYGRVVREGLTERVASGSFWKLEKLSADHVLMFAKKMKHSVFGFEPLIGYVIARRNEAAALRTIMEGKLAEMPADFIKERIPEVYV